MVNTRRSESIGSAPEITTQHRTRRSAAAEGGDESSGESEDSQGEDSTFEEQNKTEEDAPLKSRVRELRNRFVYSDRKFASRVRSEELARKRLVHSEKRSLAVYSSRNMHDDSDFIYGGNDDSEEEVYSRSRRSRQLKSRMAMIDRRTALSLRPISQKCYADPHSPLHFNSECEVAGVRRSNRKRKVQFENMSWLADDQMHKVGYPNLHTTGYSEEDSRDASETIRETSQKNTRHSNDLPGDRREIKNPKYLYDYETTEITSRRRRRGNETTLLERSKKDLRTRRESNDKENKEENGRVHSRIQNDVDTNVKDDADEDDSNEASNGVQENGIPSDDKEKDGEEVIVKVEENKRETSESDEIPRLRTRNRTANKLIMNQNFQSRRTRNHKGSETLTSESEESVRKGYSLRNRVPKPPPKAIKSSALRSRERTRHRFTRRRKPSSSDSDSTTDSDVRHIPDKYSKQPKNTHSKNEQKMKSGAGGSKIIPIGPETLDTKVRFSSIGGLDSHIQCLKEMVLLPMMYPEVFRQFQIQPPRGVLFHGPPGTGKTLIARALANECSFGCRKVSFFMRKGADLLSKWIGESEKQLRLLFEQAAEMHPSIIFFDELDGLAPVRSSRQDQVHASIVSTLLALMDGLDNRGEVIVIGATNRIDAIDPALRRPGRFDRELFFPLPAKSEREEILKVHVSQWTTPPSEQLLSYLAEHAVGYCGSDLRALCSEAVIQGFRRTYPQVYNADHRLLLNPENVRVEKIDFLRAKSSLVPASQRISQGSGRKLLPILEPLLVDALNSTYSMLEQTFPHGVNPVLAKVKLSANIKPAQLLLLGESSDCGQTTHLAPAILYKMEHIHTYILDLATLFKETGRSPEETCIQVFNEARRNIPSVIYIPNIDNWWSLVSETLKAILNSQLSHLDPNIPILLLATADTTYDNLPEEIQTMFSRYRKEVFQLDVPNEASREAFFKPLLIDSCLKPPRPQRKRPITPPQLPRAPTPPPMPITEEQAKRLFEQEEHTLRELRIFLRDMCKKLANNKLFFMFTKPVDTEEVPDYPTIIKQPMDLETMMTKVDFHRYNCAKDFLNDIELICRNALEYNPAKTSADKQIRHRACSLRDYAYTLIKNEMDSDFEDKCQDIACKRLKRKASVQKYLPAYIQTPDNVELRDSNADPPPLTPVGVTNHDTNFDEKPVEVEAVEEKSEPVRISQPSRKRRTYSWQRGFINSRKRRRREIVNHEDNVKGSTDDDSKENTPEICPLDISFNSSVEENQIPATLLEVTVVEPTAPLSINCNSTPEKPGPSSLQSPRRRLSSLMSPSELLEFPLEFDDIDQALNESTAETSLQRVDCCQEELTPILDQTVKLTYGCSLQSLLDLYNQLSRIVKKFSNTYHRSDLPKELSKELTRFKNEASQETVSERSPASSQSS